MVTRVVGRANEFDLTFTCKNGNVWEANVPSVPSGEYAVELTAEDEAGNIAYKTQTILMVDTTKLCVKLISCEHEADSKPDRYLETQVNDDMDHECCIEEHGACLIDTDLKCAVIKPCCGSERR